MSMVILSVFVQTKVTQGDERIIIEIRGALVNMLLEIDSETHKDFVIGEGRNNFLHVQMLKALYDMLMASVLHWNKFRKDIEEEGY